MCSKKHEHGVPLRHFWRVRLYPGTVRAFMVTEA